MLIPARQMLRKGLVLDLSVAFGVSQLLPCSIVLSFGTMGLSWRELAVLSYANSKR